MHSLLLLARRDLRLHPDLLLVPLGGVVLGGLIGLRHGPAGWAFSMFLIALSPLLAHAAHLREEANGTLLDLRSLPVSALQIVLLRVFQSAGVLLLGVLVACLMALPVESAKNLLGALKEVSWSLAYMLLLLGVAPLPLTLRFGKKGWIGLILTGGALSCGLFSLSLLPQRAGKVFLQVLEALTHGAQWLGNHAVAHASLLALAFLLLGALAIHALRRRSL